MIRTKIALLLSLLLISVPASAELGKGYEQGKLGKQEMAISPNYCRPDDAVPDDSVSDSDSSFVGRVSWYDYSYDGLNCDDPDCITANGETYNPEAFTTACWKEYPFGTRFRVCRLDNSHCVTVVCNDRGAFKRLGRFLDISKGAFQSLWPLSKGVVKARIEVIKE